jgi:phosphohistidine phosphatase
MRRNARGLARIAPVITKIATSPYVRALETARLVADELGVQEDIVTVDTLTPDHMSEALLPFLSALPPDANVAIVGHEPHLGRLVTWLLTGASESHVMFKKGGVALLDLGVRPSAGSAILQWLLTPGQLRAIAD